jgi:hypothetical membrane protein
VKQTQPYIVRKTKALLLCGVIGCPFFVIVFLIEGATRADYNPLRYPISSLSIGDSGWVQMANFIITGLLLLAFALGLRIQLRQAKVSTKGSLLLGLVAIGLIGAGIFSTDPVYGYPISMPLAITEFSIHGHLHVLFSILVFSGLPIACFVFSRRFTDIKKTGWAAYSTFSGVAMLVTFVLAGIGFKQYSGFVEFAGVFQRLSIIIGWTWITLLALYLFRTPNEANPPLFIGINEP